LPTINDRPGTTDLPDSYFEIERLLAESHDVVMRSTIRLLKAENALKRASQDDACNRKQLYEAHRTLGSLRSQ